MRIYPEFKIPPDQVKAWLGDRQGAIVGVDLAKRFGWKVGDRIPIVGTIWQPKQGQVWDFNIVGMYDGDAGVDKTQLFFRYDYLDENRRAGQGLVGWYVVKIADPSQAQQMGAKFDAMFANSSAETKTTTEKGFVEGFAKQVGDIGAIMIAILVAVLFTMLLVAANTMAQSVRERTSEVGVLKTLGFSNGAILALVLGESVLIAIIGGALGLGLSWLVVQNGDPTGGMPRTSRDAPRSRPPSTAPARRHTTAACFERRDSSSGDQPSAFFRVSASYSCRRPRDSRDITVPIGISRTSAIS